MIQNMDQLFEYREKTCCIIFTQSIKIIQQHILLQGKGSFLWNMIPSLTVKNKKKAQFTPKNG